MISRCVFLLLLLCSSGLASLTLTVYNMRASGLRNDQVGPADAFIRLRYGPEYFALTHTKHNTANPAWSDRIQKGNARLGQQLLLQVFDQDTRHNAQLGFCSVYIKSGSHSVSCNMYTGGRLDFMYNLM